MSDPLTPAAARQQLGPLGRLLFAPDPIPIWEHDTGTLPRVFRKMRLDYRTFAETHLAPDALAADLDPECVDVRELFKASAREGFQTEFMPPPWGTMRLRGLMHSVLLSSALKAEEFCTADGGLGLVLLAHELGIAPLFIAGNLKTYFKWMGRIYREIRAGEPAIAAFAITEPGAGSDVEETEGAANADLCCFWERAPGGFRISGRKVFISDGAVARWITLFAAEKGRGVESWTCFLLDSSMQGFSVGRRERKMASPEAPSSTRRCSATGPGSEAAGLWITRTSSFPWRTCS